MKSPEHIRFIKDWLSLARGNILFAKAGMKEDFSPYHTVCFMCQGSIEAAVRIETLVLKNIDIPT